jgi:hypothetical protein
MDRLVESAINYLEVMGTSAGLLTSRRRTADSPQTFPQTAPQTSIDPVTFSGLLVG